MIGVIIKLPAFIALRLKHTCSSIYLSVFVSLLFSLSLTHTLVLSCSLQKDFGLRVFTKGDHISFCFFYLSIGLVWYALVIPFQTTGPTAQKGFQPQHTYKHNWPLQPFSQDYELASHITHVVCINFICAAAERKSPKKRYFFRSHLSSDFWQKLSE